MTASPRLSASARLSANGGTDRVLPGIGLMLLFCLLAPLIDVSSKLAAQDVPVGVVTLGRYVVQAALMAPVVLLLRKSFTMSRRAWGLTFLRATVSVLATFSFIAAIRSMPIADALAIAFVEPFVILLIGHFLTGESVGPRRLAAAITGFAGALLVIQPSFVVFGAVALFPLATAVSFALYIIVTRRLSREVSAETMQFQTAVAGTALCLPILTFGTVIEVPDIAFTRPEGICWLWIFGVGLFATLSHMAMTYALGCAPASTLAPLHYFEMLSATFFSYLVFDDFPDLLSWLGIAIITGSGLYIVHRERVTARQAPQRDGASAAG